MTLRFPSSVFLSGAALVLLLGVDGCAKRGLSAPTCVAQTCLSLGVSCGQTLDQCGGILQCGACADGQTCGAAGVNICGVGVCTAATCATAGLSCGLLADGCGVVVDCGACDATGVQGTGGDANLGSGGLTSTGGVAAATGGAGTGSGSGVIVTTCDYGTTVLNPAGSLGKGAQANSGSTSEQYGKAGVSRDGRPYQFIANGWGPGFQSHNLSWNGTSFKVASLNGTKGGGGEPAGYPTMYCGKYSPDEQPACGLPKAISALSSLRTGLRWSGPAAGAYNAAYDIWLGDGYNLQSYLMVWLRRPTTTERPAGAAKKSCVAVANVPGFWDIWAGQVNGHPIVNYVRPKGAEISELEFDVLDFYKDANMRSAEIGVSLVGSQVNSVAVGFEVWTSTAGLEVSDFYVTPN